MNKFVHLEGVSMKKKKRNKTAEKVVQEPIKVEQQEQEQEQEQEVKTAEDFFSGKYIFWISFGLILLLSLGLRLTLIQFPLWYDEGCSIATAVNSFPAGITDYLWNRDLQHTPLYFYILHYIMQFFGDGVVVLRLSSLIVSMALLPLTYIVTEKVSSKKVALFAMLLMGVNTFQVLYSIEVRMYPYVILLSLLSFNYLIDYDKKGDTESLIKLGIANLLNPYFLTGSIVFVIAQFIIYTCYLDWQKADSEKIKKYVISNLFVLLGFIPYFIIIGHYAMVRSHFLVTDIASFSATNFWGMFQNLVSCDAGHIHETRFEPFFNYLKGDTPDILHKNSVMEMKVWTLIILPIIAMFVGLLHSLRDKEKLNHVMLGTITLCFVIFVFLSNARVIAFTGRYLIFITPFIFILMAVGISKLNKYLVTSFIVLYSIGCIVGLNLSYNWYKDIAEFSLKSPADWAKAHCPGKTNLVIMPFASSVSFYYFKDDDMPTVMPLELFHQVRDPNNTNIYDDYQREALQKGDKYIEFQKYITGDKPFSKNLIKYLNSYISKVPRGGYIMWVVYYSDNYAIKPPEFVKKYYGDLNNVRAYTMTGVLSKFDIDLISLLLSQCNFVKKDHDLSNSFFLFQKR